MFPNAEYVTLDFSAVSVSGKGLTFISSLRSLLCARHATAIASPDKQHSRAGPILLNVQVRKLRFRLINLPIVTLVA